jgi:DNA-binding transcriptional LysR family regulator
MQYIQTMNFAALDLNLLRVFNAMMIDLSTVRAGERVGLSQPAVSSALGRLRLIMGDDLFVRDGNRMVPTPKALALRDPIRSALQQMEDALAQVVTFDPATADKTFTIAGSDYISTFLMPRLAGRTRLEAPGVTVQLLDFPPNRVFQLLSEGRVDVAVERGLKPPEWIHCTTLFRSFVVCIARKDHPALMRSGIERGARLTPEVYCEIPQVILSTDGSKSGSMERELHRLGFRRRIAMTVPHFQAIALATAGSDLLGNMPVHFARYAARLFDLDLYLPPVDPPIVQMRMYWHRRLERDPAQNWLREAIRAAMDFDTPYPPPNLGKADKLPWES